MTTLTRIQMVVHLQTVELFTHCTAEQMVRIAAIARQRVFHRGETIYSINDSAEALYCVVEGDVELRNGDPLGDATPSPRRAGSRGTFGVREILSGRLRTEDAVATADGIALEIEAEDFFDLLSNNIEIVKALFRQLLRPSPQDARLAGPVNTSPGGSSPEARSSQNI